MALVVSIQAITHTKEIEATMVTPHQAGPTSRNFFMGVARKLDDSYRFFLIPQPYAVFRSFAR